MTVSLALTAGAAVYLCLRKKLTTETAVVLLFICGCIMRIGYGMAVHHKIPAHDSIFGGSFEESYGHAAYILHIVQNWALPDTNLPWQFYHPPLYHITSALFFAANQALGLEYIVIAENLQYLNGLFSCLMLLVWIKIFRQFSLKGAGLLVPAALMAFHPAFFVMGGCLNNDILMWLLISLTLLYLLKWYQDPTLKNIAVMGLCLGLGVMTKISAIMIAPVIAIVFLIKLYMFFKKKKPSAFLWAQFACFAVASIPLAVWYPIRNFIRFGQSFTYVPELGVDSTQYIGHIPLLKRFLPLDLQAVFESPFVRWEGLDYNILIHLEKTSLFGEKGYLKDIDPQMILAFSLTAVNYLLLFISFAAIVRALALCQKDESLIPYLFLFLYYVIMSVSYSSFCVQYPHQCTMDIRYIAVNIPIGLLFTGLLCQKPTQNQNGHTSALGRFHFFARVGIATATVLFCLLSAVIYSLVGL